MALQVLFQEDLNPDHDLEAADRFIRRRLHYDAALVDFAIGLIAGVRRHRAELDALLTARAAHWSLRRMAATDRNVLRLGAYEILFTDTPERVVINEAVELARRFGTRQSGLFVNGLLDRVARERTDQVVERAARSE